MQVLFLKSPSGLLLKQKNISKNIIMEEFLIDKYFTQNNLMTIIEGLSPYYQNNNVNVDLLEFLNKAFDYNIVRQWFVEGILMLVANKTLEIVEF